MSRDYSRIEYKAKCRTKYGECLKILTLQQMLQRLPIAHAQVKTSNVSENLLNKIRQVYGLYSEWKKLLKRI